MLNLILNACEATPRNWWVAVSVTLTPEESFGAAANTTASAVHNIPEGLAIASC